MVDIQAKMNVTSTPFNDPFCLYPQVIGDKEFLKPLS